MLKRVAAAVAVAASALVAAPAHADISTDGSSGGYSVSVTDVVITSDSPAVSSGTVSLPVPLKCWWEQMTADSTLEGDFDADDSEAFKEYYDEMIVQMRGHAAAGYFSFPPVEYVQSILRQERSGTSFTWHRLAWREGVDPVSECGIDSRGTVGDAYGANGAGDAVDQAIPISFRAFVQGTEPPVTVDLDGLAQVLWDHADASIEAAELDRNPRIASEGGATLVNLPTWFWVTNPGAALANDGSIHLEATAGSATATLDASTDGVTVTSPVGARRCSVEQVRTAYARGASEDQACTIDLQRAGTWPVTATTTWTGSWQAQQGGESASGTLDAIGRSSTVEVPVAESQALVREVD